VTDKGIVQIEGGVSPKDATDGFREDEAKYATGWYASIPRISGVDRPGSVVRSHKAASAALCFFSVAVREHDREFALRLSSIRMKPTCALASAGWLRFSGTRIRIMRTPPG